MSGSAIFLNELSYTYPTGKEGASGISLEIKSGEFVAIMGANGSGKTTILKMLVGLLKPTSGSVAVDRQKVGFVFQDPDDQLFMPTVAEDVAYGPLNMGLPKPEVELRVARSLEAVGAADLGDRSIHHLSGGQKKRVAIAGVLAMGSEILILDEPTASLDPAGTSSIMKLLKRLNEVDGLTVVMATHDVDLIPVYADRVFVVNEGRLVAGGTFQEVFSESELIRKSRLRLPRVSHLVEILRKRYTDLPEDLPMTIGQARKELSKAFESGLEDRVHDRNVCGGGR